MQTFSVCIIECVQGKSINSPANSPLWLLSVYFSKTEKEKKIQFMHIPPGLQVIMADMGLALFQLKMYHAKNWSVYVQPD